MAVNKNALIRYKTIDKCLQNRYRKWTLDDLIDKCSDALYEYEGIDNGVSRRTVQADIQIMRSDKLGYNAPIIVVDKKYYTYEDPEYSITNIPISENDLNKMSEAVELLRQFKGFSHFKELDSMIQKLEDHVYSQRTDQKPVIDLEKNEDLKGIHYLNELYQAIVSKTPVKITYQSFKARSAHSFDFHPYLLKEFRNRWFVIGKKDNGEGILNLGLDRIINIEKSKARYKNQGDFDPAEYFQHVIGVTVNKSKPPQQIVIKVSHQHAPYVATKPFHWSQEVLGKDKEGITFKFQVQHNFELEKDILGFGEAIEVIAPKSLRNSIKIRLKEAYNRYQN